MTIGLTRNTAMPVTIAMAGWLPEAVRRAHDQYETEVYLYRMPPRRTAERTADQSGG